MFDLLEFYQTRLLLLKDERDKAQDRLLKGMGDTMLNKAALVAYQVQMIEVEAWIQKMKGI